MIESLASYVANWQMCRHMCPYTHIETPYVSMSKGCYVDTVLGCFSHVRLFVTLWTVHQAPLSIGFSRQEYRSGLPCSPPADLPNPGIESMCFMSPALAGGFIATHATWEAHTQLY